MDILQVEVKLNSFFEKEYDKLAIINLLDEIGSEQQLKYLLNSILSNEEKINTCSSQSEFHRLGFDKICLLSNPKYQLRLHIWRPQKKFKSEGIHNHKFNFVSRIIKGNLHHTLYERCNTEDPHAMLLHEYIFSPKENPKESDTFQYKGISPLKMVSDEIYPRNTIYNLHHEAFHNAIPTNNNVLTATLFLRTSNIKSSDTIFERIPFVETSKPNITFTSMDYREQLTNLINQLG